MLKLKYLKSFLVSGLVMASLAACGKAEQASAPVESVAEANVSANTNTDIKKDTLPEDYAVQLVYLEEEAGVDPYQVRIVVTRKYMRIDDTDEGKSFVLLDRTAGVVYSVAEANDAVLVLDPRIPEPRPTWSQQLVEKQVANENAPEIGGLKGVRYDYFLGDKSCIGAVVVKDLLPEAYKALAEYRSILANQHLASIDTTPIESQIPCDLAINIYEPNRYVSNGLPVIEWNYSGFRRSLVDYNETFKVPADLFKLPEKYGRFNLDEMRRRAMDAVSTPQTTAPKTTAPQTSAPQTTP